METVRIRQKYSRHVCKLSGPMALGELKKDAMAKSKKRVLPEGHILADGEPLNLGNRHLAAVLAWLIPGAGHYYQKRYFKSAIFSVAVFSTFLIGMVVSGSRCVYASWQPSEKRWQFVLQAGNGFAAIPAGVQYMAARQGVTPPLGSFMTAPNSVRELDDWHEKTASGFDMGTLYTMISGLLNVLIVFDAFSGPLPPPVSKSKASENSDETEGDDQPSKGEPKSSSEQENASKASAGDRGEEAAKPKDKQRKQSKKGVQS